MLGVLLVFNFGVAVSRIRTEERLMLKLFGDAYVQFMKSRGAFLPWRVLDCGVPLEEAEEMAGLRVNESV